MSISLEVSDKQEEERLQQTQPLFGATVFHTSILTTDGPLAHIWISAHWKRNKLSKRVVQGMDIPACTRIIIKPKDGPMALRLSGQLLLGLVRIYSLKVRYLHEECNNSYSKMRLQRSKVYLEPQGQQALAPSNQIPEDINLDDLVMANVLMNPEEDVLNNDLFFVDGGLPGLGDSLEGGGAEGKDLLNQDSTSIGISVVRGDQSTLGLEAMREGGDVDDLSLLAGGDSDGKAFANLMGADFGVLEHEGFGMGLDPDDMMEMDFDLPPVGGAGGEEAPSSAASAIEGRLQPEGSEDFLLSLPQVVAEDELALPLPETSEEDILAQSAQQQLTGRKRKRSREAEQRGTGREIVVIQARAGASRIPRSRRELPDERTELGKESFSEESARRLRGERRKFSFGKRARWMAQVQDEFALNSLLDSTLVSVLDFPAAASMIAEFAVTSAAAAAAAEDDIGDDDDGLDGGMELGESGEVLAGGSGMSVEAAFGKLRALAQGAELPDPEELRAEDDLGDLEQEMEDFQIVDPDAILEGDEGFMPDSDAPLDLDDLHLQDDTMFLGGPEEAKEGEEESLLFSRGDQPTKAKVFQKIQAGAGEEAGVTSFQKHVLGEFDEKWKAQVFYKLLELKTMDIVDVKQDAPYSDIQVVPGPKFQDWVAQEA